MSGAAEASGCGDSFTRLRAAVLDGSPCRQDDKREGGCHIIEPTPHWTTKCELLVDAKQVDSGAVPLLGGTLKLADTVNGTMVNVTSGKGLRPKVVLLADGEERLLSRKKV